MNEVRISTEDTKVVASRVNARWFVTVQDLLGPEKQECQMSDEEFAAVVAFSDWRRRTKKRQSFCMKSRNHKWKSGSWSAGFASFRRL